MSIKPFKLAYVNFSTNNLEGMSHYYKDIMGLSQVEEGDKGELYLSCGLDHHNMILTPDSENDLKAMGYQVSNESLDEVEKVLEEEGIEYERRTDAAPGIKEMIVFKDVDGFQLELFNEMEIPAPGFNEHGISPFKLGHLALGSINPKKQVAFYKEVLNFHYTDTISTRATFLTCNEDHHTLNISDIGYATLHHIAFELKDASHQYRSHDILAQREIPILWGPTRHTAGHNIASYHHDPDLNLVELYIDMDIYRPELGYFDPRPWHEDLPQRPKVWDDNASWKTAYEITILESALKKLEVKNK